MMTGQARQVAMSQIKPKHCYLTSLEKLLTAIGQESDKKKVLGLILPCALSISQAELGTLLVTGDKPTNMKAVAKQGLPDEVIIQLTTGDLGRLLLMGQRLWIKPQTRQLNPSQALLGRNKLKYLFGLPLRFAGEVLGALVVGSHTNRLHQTQQDQLENLAQLVALFLDDIRLRTQHRHASQKRSDQAAAEPEEASETSSRSLDFDTTTEDDMEQLLAAIMSAEEEVANQNNDLGLLNALSNEVGSSLQMNTILDTAIQQTQTALKAEVGWCYVLHDGALALSEHRGLSEEYVSGMHHLTPGNGVEGMAFTRNEPILRDGLLFHDGQARRLVQQEGLRTIAAVPLTNDEGPFGVLAVANRHDREWSARDKRMMVSIGQQVSRAIINSQRFTNIEQKAQSWEANYAGLKQTNARLTARANALETQVAELRQLEQQIWTALAASKHARCNLYGNTSDPQTEELVTTLKKALTTLRQSPARSAGGKE